MIPFDDEDNEEYCEECGEELPCECDESEQDEDEDEA